MEQTDMQTLRAAVFIDKGGVGKTTSTAHFGVCAARDWDEYRVLLVDLAGKQNDLAKHFGIATELPPEDDRVPNISTVFRDDWPSLREQIPNAVEKLIYETKEGIDLIPSHRGLDAVDDELASVPLEKRVRRLEQFLDEDIDPLGYDLVLIDLPGLTTNITYNGVIAARNVWVPVEPGAFERDQLDAVRQDIDEIENGVGVTINLAMVLPNRVSTQTKVDSAFLEDVTDAYDGVLAPSAVPDSQDFKNTQSAGTTIFGLDEENRLATGERAVSAYETNTHALLERLEVAHE